MVLRAVHWALLLQLVVFSTAGALEIDLRAAQRMALEANLELRAQVHATGAAEAVERSTHGIYDPRLGLDARVANSREEFNLQFFSGQTATETRALTFSLLQAMPTGAQLALKIGSERQTADPSLFTDPAYSSRWQLTLTQPLLRDFGRTVTEQDLLFAVENSRISYQDLREQAFSLLDRVRKTYFEILQRREELHYRETSVALASRLLEENRVKVRAGALAPIEILEAEVGLQLRERERLDAERQYRDALDRLAVLLNAPEPVKVIGEFGQPELRPDEEVGVAAALEKRPDLARRKAEIAGLQLDRQLARNRMLPALDLSASYGHAGLDRRFGDSFDELAEDDLRRWEVGLNFTYPLGNRGARHDHRRAELLEQSVRYRLHQLEVEVRRQIKAAIRLLEVSRKKIEVTRLGRKLAEEQLRTLLKRREVGLATTRQVLEGEEDLAEAQTLLSEALAEYNVAVTDYFRTTGLLLEHEGVSFRRTEHITPVLD